MEQQVSGWPARSTSLPAHTRTARDNRVLVVVVALILAVLAGAGSYVRSSMLDPIIYNYWGFGDKQSGPKTIDLLMDSDVPHMRNLMTDRHSGSHWRSSEHPLMSLVMFPPVSALRKMGLSELKAIWVTVAALCAVWGSLLFALLMLWGCRLADAVVFTLLAQVSASAVFWFSVPETFAFGSATIVAALILVLWPRHLSPLVRYTLAIAVSFSMTVTNVMVGLIAAARKLPYRDLALAFACGLIIVGLLWVLQKLLFPTTTFFFPPRSTMPKYTFVPTPSRIAEVTQAFALHTVVMPDIQLLSGSTQRLMSVQTSLAGTGSISGAIATVAWLALLVMGLRAVLQARDGLGLVCAYAAAAQLAFHIWFGPQTFLFAPHFLPLLIVLAAGVTFTTLRPLGLALAVVVVVLGGLNNWGQFEKAVGIVADTAAWARTFPGAQPP